MAETDTRYLSEVLTDARDNDLGSWLTKVTVADILPHNPISNGYLIPLPKTSVLSTRAQDYIVVKWNKKRRDARVAERELARSGEPSGHRWMSTGELSTAC